MTAPTDAKRAREIVWTMRSGHQCADIRCGACAEFISAALAAVRAEERERCARIAEEWGAGDSRAQANSVTCRKIARAIRRREG